MAGEQGSDAGGTGMDRDSVPGSEAAPEAASDGGQRTAQVGAREVVRPAGTIDEVSDGEGSLADRLARKDNTPAGAGDAGVG